ncbi:MAG: hypothetical protein ACRDN9_14090, partial [Streptosporangiaceae bacterium]
MDGKRDREPFAFDGRSLEEQLASLDALSGERWEPPHDEAGPDEGDSRPDEAAGEGQSRPEPPEPAAADPPGPAPSILSTMGPYAQERPPAFEAPRDPEAGSEQESWPQEGLDDVSADGSAEVPFGMPGERPSFFGQPFAVQTNDEPTAQFTGVSPAPEGEPAGEASLRPADDAQEGPARDPAPAVVAGD